jgi:5-methylcytosine-specific restriction endonuclease McrA
MTVDPGYRYWLGSVVPLSQAEAAILYWTTDIPAAEIIETYAPGLPSNQITTIAGQAYSPFICETCDGPVIVGSRSTAQSLFSDERKAAKAKSRGWKHWHRVICKRCRLVEQERRAAPYREEMRRREERSRELRTMPYRDYLQTPEWQTTRSNALRRARFRCQACAEGGNLHVHHRTYVRRGAEYASDLIVLCADCHRVFHERRSLADGGRAAA